MIFSKFDMQVLLLMGVLKKNDLKENKSDLSNNILLLMLFIIIWGSMLSIKYIYISFIAISLLMFVKILILNRKVETIKSLHSSLREYMSFPENIKINNTVSHYIRSILYFLFAMLIGCLIFYCYEKYKSEITLFVSVNVLIIIDFVLYSRLKKCAASPPP